MEIRRRAGDRRFAHVLFLSRTSELLGKRRYWPIFEAAVEAGFPIGVHVFGSSGRPMSNTGWPSVYIEEITEHSASLAGSVTSLIVEGVFEGLSRTQDRADRSGLCLDSVTRLASRPELEAHEGRGSAPAARAVGVSARAFLGLDPADGRSGRARPRARRHGVDRLGQDPVRQRL